MVWFVLLLLVQVSWFLHPEQPSVFQRRLLFPEHVEIRGPRITSNSISFSPSLSSFIPPAGSWKLCNENCWGSKAGGNVQDGGFRDASIIWMGRKWPRKSGWKQHQCKLIAGQPQVTWKSYTHRWVLSLESECHLDSLCDSGDMLCVFVRDWLPFLHQEDQSMTGGLAQALVTWSGIVAETRSFPALPHQLILAQPPSLRLAMILFLLCISFFQCFICAFDCFLTVLRSCLLFCI